MAAHRTHDIIPSCQPLPSEGVIYDTCKALTHRILIREIGLVEKTGGKGDWHLELA